MLQFLAVSPLLLLLPISFRETRQFYQVKQIPAARSSPQAGHMGGDTLTTPFVATPSEESSIDHDFSGSLSPGFSFHPRDLDAKEVEGADDEEDHSVSQEELDGVIERISGIRLEVESKKMNKRRAYAEILASYDQLNVRSEALEDAKIKILSYTPGKWIENGRARKYCTNYVPETTTLLLVGPKGSGKSSLINRISKVFEKDKFASERAQVSCNSSVADGTYFLQEYMIPRNSSSFCVYDTRGLSDDSSDNIEMLKHWMTKGVQNGELIVRPSDSPSLKARMESKVHGNVCWSKERSMVNFVIYVINGLELLEAMESNSEEGRIYTQMIVTTFNTPYLSFKDDKPVVAVTHGDLISLADRARIRVYLGDLLGIPAAKQIYDIPEKCDPATEFAIANMLVYALEHAEKHMPPRGHRHSPFRQIHVPALLKYFCLALLVGIPLFSFCMQHARWEPENFSTMHCSDSVHAVSCNYTSGHKAFEDPSSRKAVEDPSCCKPCADPSSRRSSEDPSSRRPSEDTFCSKAYEDTNSEACKDAFLHQASEHSYNGKESEDSSSSKASEGSSSHKAYEDLSSRKASEDLSSRKASENSSSRKASRISNNGKASRISNNGKASEDSSSCKASEDSSSRKTSGISNSGEESEDSSSRKAYEDSSGREASEDSSSREASRLSSDGKLDWPSVRHLWLD